tara:strand:- start:6756 stop:7241 length:486 start_codon:yes stop_codon:yes gene_type:complete
MTENIIKKTIHIPPNFRVYPELCGMLHEATERERQRMSQDQKYAGRQVYAPPIASSLWKFDEGKKVWQKTTMFANQDRNDASKYYFTIEIKLCQTQPQEAIDQEQRRKENAAKFSGNKPNNYNNSNNQSSNTYDAKQDQSVFGQKEVEQKQTPPTFDDLDF